MRERVEEFTERTNADFAAATPRTSTRRRSETVRLAEELADEIVAEELKAYEVEDDRSG